MIMVSTDNSYRANDSNCGENCKELLAAPISQINFWNKTLHVSDSSFVHHQEIFTVHTAMVYVTHVTATACEQDPTRNLSANMYDKYHCLCVRCKTPDDGQRNCPKHAEFYSKNKLEKLVHLAGFIIRIYHDARSSERQIRISFSFWAGISYSSANGRSETCNIINNTLFYFNVSL